MNSKLEIKIASALVTSMVSLVANASEPNSKLAIQSQHDGLVMHVWGDELTISFAPGPKDASLVQLNPQLTIKYDQKIKFGWESETDFLVCKSGWSDERYDKERVVSSDGKNFVIRISTTDSFFACEGPNFLSYSDVSQTD